MMEHPILSKKCIGLLVSFSQGMILGTQYCYKNVIVWLRVACAANELNTG